tara:strand:+ start:352 stop:1347 length:996 start_codon:yes stop_codon:yes gene_type:complete
VLNVLSLPGPSRCGKGAIIPIIAAIKNFELPFNTPDLDWYVDAYNFGDINLESLCRLSSNYLLCYSWYGHLGRHINLRPNDYYSLQKLMPHINLVEKHDRGDKDKVFEDFLQKNDSGKFWNIFQWDIPIEVYEAFEKDYPINSNPLYCYRSPYSLFTSWISSNRVKRSRSLSRMFKYESTPFLTRQDLLSQFEDARNDNEVTFIKELGTYKYHELKLEDVEITAEEESRLTKLIEENKKNADYWSQKDMLIRFENLVSDPDPFIQYLKNRFNIEFNDKLLQQGIVLMDKRPLESVIEMNFKNIEGTLKNLGCKRETIEYILNEQKEYISEL